MRALLVFVAVAAAACTANGEYETTARAVATEPGAFAGFPLVGFGGAKNAAIWIASTSRDTTAELALHKQGRNTRPEVYAFPAQAEASGSQTLRLSRLEPDTKYNYVVTIRGTTSTTAQGSFRTSPRKGDPVRATFAVASCMNVALLPHQVAWNAVMRENPSLLIQLGDNIYASGNRPVRARGFHFRQRTVPEYRRVLSRVPVLAVWDDHDYIGNDSDGTALEKEGSLALFREVFPNPNAGLPDTPGVFFAADYGDVDIFLLDVRYHRTPRTEPIETRSILGDAQLLWLEQKLKASSATFKLIGSGSTLHRGDAWSNYPRDLRRLFELTREVPGMVMLTGDLHRSGLLDWGENIHGPLSYPLLEVTSSGVAIEAPLFSFVTLHLDTQKSDPELKAVVHRVDENGVEQEREVRTILRSQLQARK